MGKSSAHRAWMLACLWIVSFPAVAGAALPPMQDAENVVFSATGVVIVSPAKEDVFAVGESFLGTLAPKETVTLAGFKLVTWSDDFRGPTPQPITARTRILLFLCPHAKDEKKWAVTDDGYAYFSRDVDDVGQLRDLAERAVMLRRRWEKTVALKEPQTRLEELWPYVRNSPPACQKLTLIELAKLNPLPGDYLAERLASYAPDERASLMLLARQIPSENLHAAMISDVLAASEAFEAYLADHHIPALDVTGHWNDGTLIESVKSTYGEVYCGLAGIRSFKVKNDLPLFRERVPWLLRNRFDQAVEECVYMMREFPDPENLPVLKSIWDDHKGRTFKDGSEGSLPIDLARALAASKSPDAIPILSEIRKRDRFRDEADNAIREIGGAK